MIARGATSSAMDGRRTAGWTFFCSNHQPRAGLATSAAAGKSERAIMQQTDHRSANTVRRYIRDGNLFRENAAESIGSE
jgi:hypothetical protein